MCYGEVGEHLAEAVVKAVLQHGGHKIALLGKDLKDH